MKIRLALRIVLSKRSYLETKQSKFKAIDFNAYTVIESGISNKQRDNTNMGNILFLEDKIPHFVNLMYAAEYIITVVQKFYIGEKTDYQNYRKITMKGIKKCEQRTELGGKNTQV